MCVAACWHRTYSAMFKPALRSVLTSMFAFHGERSGGSERFKDLPKVT